MEIEQIDDRIDNDFYLESFHYNSTVESNNNNNPHHQRSDIHQDDEYANMAQLQKDISTELDYIKEEKKMSRIKRKYKKLDKRLVNKLLFYQPILSKQMYKLFSGISISNDGVLRYCYCMSQVSFGFCSQQLLCVEEMHDIGIVNQHMSIDYALPKKSVQESISLLGNYNSNDFQITDIADGLMGFQSALLMKFQDKFMLTPDLLLKKEIEFTEYIKHAFFFLQEFRQKNPQKMFSYAIGRFNFIESDVEIVHSGFSKTYLSLLGLDSTTFKSILLRNQKVDLMKQKSEIIRQVLTGIQQKSEYETEDKYTADIVTFDGFPIRLNITIQNVTLAQKINNVFGREYILAISQVEVDQKELQSLIAYRNKIANNPQNLSLEEYIKKELSYLFEDVEYSVHSQNFIEQYYKDNLQQLLTLEQFLLNNNEEKRRKQCGIRYIKQDNTNSNNTYYNLYK